jgi:hypothetical protein
MELLMKKFKELRKDCACMKEDGGVAVPGPTVTTGPQSATDPVSATAIKLPKNKNKYPTLSRKPPQM